MNDIDPNLSKLVALVAWGIGMTFPDYPGTNTGLQWLEDHGFDGQLVTDCLRIEADS